MIDTLNLDLELIKKILNHGNDVEIRRKGDGYIILEVKKKIISSD